MIVIVDERVLVRQGYISQFEGEGIPAAGFDCHEFEIWVKTANEQDLTSVTACLLGDSELEELSPKTIRSKIEAPVIALIDQASLELTLKLFESGVDDVLRKPVHVREIIARTAAIQRRSSDRKVSIELGRLHVFLDGRDPEIDNRVFPLPRRERRILEYLASIGDRRANKTQIFNAIYGVFNEDVEENVVESHISKLRKKLRNAIGYDPIDSKRYLGYRLMPVTEEQAKEAYESKLIGISA